MFMNTKIFKIFCAGIVSCSFAVTLTSCDKFIEEEPRGVISGGEAMSEPDKMLTAAYAKLVTTGTPIRLTCGHTVT